MNHLCCQTCLTYDTDDDKPYIGFHAQDNERINKAGYTHLTHGPPVDDDHYPAYWSELAVMVIEDYGLTVEWDGTMASRIKVLLPETMPLDTPYWEELRDELEVTV